VQHCTPEQLALAALREPLPDGDATHLASCEQCRAEVASLRRSVEAVAVPQLAAPSTSVDPPPRVWEAIAAATGVSAAEPATPPSRAEVVPLRPRRSRWLLVAAAAVAGAAVGAGAVAVVQNDDDGVPVASAELDPVDANDASGRASVVELDDGTRLLRVALDAPRLADGYYEVWLLEPDVSGLIPVGVTQAGTTVTFELPTGLDLADFPVVDVSVEPLDGDPEHSGDSVVRGELDA
jgi:hypothetical protein